MNKAVYFNHGRESGPWGDKITVLARVARERGYEVESLDYTGIMDPAERLRRLLASDAAHADSLILVGSSLGGWVAAAASESLRPRGLFLLAPAFYLPDFPSAEPVPHAERVDLVHGWNDNVIPFSHSIRYSEKFKANLHLVDSDHRLSTQLPLISQIFSGFVDSME